jgi:hypothetical protein
LHYFVHYLAVACTQLRKAGIETAGAVDAASLEEHLITCVASARRYSAEEEAGLRATVPELVKYRAALVVMRWASEERKCDCLSGPVGKAWLHTSADVSISLIERRIWWIEQAYMLYYMPDKYDRPFDMIEGWRYSSQRRPRHHATRVPQAADLGGPPRPFIFESSSFYSEYKSPPI